MKKAIILAALLCFSFQEMAQWVQQGLGYEQASLGTRSISIVSENIVWTAVTYGTSQPRYSRTNNGGVTWIPGIISGYDGNSIFRLFALSYDTVWVILKSPGSNFFLLKTIDGGQNWQEQLNSITLQSPIYNLYFWNSDKGFLLGDQLGGYFGFYTTLNGGDTWSRVDSVNIPLPWPSSDGEYTITFSAVDSNIFIPTSVGRLYKSVDYGFHWSVLTTPYCFSTYMNHTVYFQNIYHGIFKKFEDNYNFYETFDGGINWTLVSPAGPFYRYDFAWVPGTTNTCISVGTGTYAGCTYSFDGGHTWTAFDSLEGTNLLCTGWLNNFTGWAAGYTTLPTPTNTGIYKYTGTLVSILQMDPIKGDVTFYPNPCNRLVNMVLVGFLGEDVVLDLFNLQGQKVFTEEFHQTLIQSDRKIDLSFLKSGTYVVSVRSGKKCLVKKIVVEE
ncbi:MAG: T9SS type A sorting domain-containing protein [Bacteroidetes bacterium]|nr:T9SS type A sorting domain-containing protein [Bacteroidota bacterium]